MRADTIDVGQPYAYVDPDYSQDPICAVVLAEPDDGVVLVELNYPDTGRDQQTVSTRTLYGPWAEEPIGKAWQAAVGELHEAGEDATWAGVQARRLDLVRRQRALAARLKKVTGIERKPAAYAGRGGTGTSTFDLKLQLNYNELESLLSAVENAGRPNTAIDPAAVQSL